MNKIYRIYGYGIAERKYFATASIALRFLHKNCPKTCVLVSEDSNVYDHYTDQLPEPVIKWSWQPPGRPDLRTEGTIRGFSVMDDVVL